MKIVIATNNSGKFNELKQMLDMPDVEYLSLSDFNVKGPEEPGETYVENAIIKTRYAAMNIGIPSIGDDSGLEIEALGGQPGIRSARCAGENASGDEKRDYILDLMRDKHYKRARFICSLAFVSPHFLTMPSVFTGFADGTITLRAFGEYDEGLQYDSIFYCPRLNLTFAEMSKEMKNKVSHRADACAKMKQYVGGIIKKYNRGFGNV